MDDEGLLVGVDGVDEGLLSVLHWVIWFWYEADDIVHFASVAIWVLSVLFEEWLTDVLDLSGELLFVIILELTVYANCW